MSPKSPNPPNESTFWLVKIDAKKKAKIEALARTLGHNKKVMLDKIVTHFLDSHAT